MQLILYEKEGDKEREMMREREKMKEREKEWQNKKREDERERVIKRVCEFGRKNQHCMVIKYHALSLKITCRFEIDSHQTVLDLTSNSEHNLPINIVNSKQCIIKKGSASISSY